MRGPRTFPSTKIPSSFLAALLLPGVIALLSCSASQEADRKPPSGGAAPELLQRYEKTFDPAEFDPDITLVKAEEKAQRAAVEPTALVTTAVPETVQGFRVQILLTQDIDEAVRCKDSVESLLPDEWSYIVYDSPYYKVRVGNCEDRGTANPIVKKLGALGFKEAWVVPDNILKNLPPRPPELNIEPEKQPENHRQ